MSGTATLSGQLTAAELHFYTEVLRSVPKVGGHMLKRTRSNTDGTVDILTRAARQWITLDKEKLRSALIMLGSVEPGLTIACDHGYRVDRLITALAHNSEAEYDECLMDGVLQIAVLGKVQYDSSTEE